MSPSTLYTQARKILRSYDTDAGRQAARNLVGTTVCTILGQLCTLATLLLLTHALGKDEYGVFSYTQVVQQYLLLFTTGALAQIVIRDGVRHPQQMDEIETAFLLGTGTLSGVLCLITVAFALFVPIGSDERMVLVLMSLGNVAGCMNVRCWFEVHHRQTRDSIITLLGEIATLATLLALRWSGSLTLVATALVYAVKWAVTSAVLFAVYHWTVRRMRFAFSAAHLRAMLWSAWPLMLASLVVMVPFNMGGLLLRIFDGEGAAGVFGIAAQIALAYLNFAQLANRIVRPHILGAYGLEKSFIRKLVLFKIAFLVLLLAAAFLGAWIVIVYLLPVAFRGALVPTAFLLGAALLAAVGRTAGNYMVLLRSERAFLIANVCGAVVYVAGSLLVVSTLSYTGTALMTSLASLVSLALVLLSLRARLRDRVG